MAEQKQSNKDRLREITAGIEQGIKELFESDKYRQYLTTMSRFHRYSVNNTMLIYMQKPDATLVAGYNKWRDQFERHVKRGEHGITIIAPTPYRKKIEEEKLDPDTKAPMLDAEGKVIMEEKTIEIPMFKPVKVFDVSQTDGKPLPQLASDLAGNVQQYEEFIEALRRTSPVPISFSPLPDDTDGFFNLDDQSITIRSGMSEVQTVSAVVHEIAHSMLHNNKKIDEPKDAQKYQEVEIFDVPGLFSNGRINPADIPKGMYCYDLRGSDDDPGFPIAVENHVTVNHAGSVITAKPLELGEDGRLMFTEDEGLNFVGGEISAYRFVNEQRKDRNTEEVEAESISYAVCKYYGIQTSDNSFGYIATWSQGKELAELRSSLETINKTASSLITDIDKHFREICKERGIDLAAPAEQKAETVPEPEAEVIPEQKPLVEPTPVVEQEPDEALYLVDDSLYLHVQQTDGGWDYSIYDKETSKLVDGGVLECGVIEESPVKNPLAAARTEIFQLQGLQPTSVIFADIALLEQLQEAQMAELSMLPDSPEQTIDEPLPDPTIAVWMMNHYGYTDADMLPLSKDRALELADRDITVYMLYPDNTEAMVFDEEDLVKHDGLFGITREDWGAIKTEIPPRNIEQRFKDNPQDAFLLYQLRTDVPHGLAFAWYDELDAPPAYSNYAPIYTGDLGNGHTPADHMNGLFYTFNEQNPGDFTGHSLSVSDIIALKLDGAVSYHYVDHYGFKELPNFIPPENYLKAAEMSMEDDYNMIDGIINNGPKQTVAELEQQARSGQPISLMDLAEAVHREQREKKKSVVEQLKAPQKPTKTRTKTAHKKSAEQEI